MLNRERHLRGLAALALLAVLVTPASLLAQEAAHAAEANETSRTGRGGPLNLSPPQTGVSEAAPPRDNVGGFALGVLAGVQLRGSAPGQFGLSLAWFKQSTSNVGLEVEGAFTQGPDGQVYHGLVSVILQSGSRATRIVPYLALGGGVFHAKEQIRGALQEALPEFGIDPTANSETGGLIAAGGGVRYYLSERLSFRADYREMRGITSAAGGFFDKLHTMRRVGGFLMLRF